MGGKEDGESGEEDTAIGGEAVKITKVYFLEENVLS